MFLYLITFQRPIIIVIIIIWPGHMFFKEEHLNFYKKYLYINIYVLLAPNEFSFLNSQNRKHGFIEFKTLIN